MDMKHSSHISRSALVTELSQAAFSVVSNFMMGYTKRLISQVLPCSGIISGTLTKSISLSRLINLEDIEALEVSHISFMFEGHQTLFRLQWIPPTSPLSSTATSSSSSSSQISFTHVPSTLPSILQPPAYDPSSRLKRKSPHTVFCTCRQCTSAMKSKYQQQLLGIEFKEGVREKVVSVMINAEKLQGEERPVDATGTYDQANHTIVMQKLATIDTTELKRLRDQCDPLITEIEVCPDASVVLHLSA